MIGFLKGTITDIDITTGQIIIMVNNVGYLVTVSSTLLTSLNLESEIALFIQPEIREDAFDLVGFQSKEEKKFYKKVRSVNGVGSKTAVNVMNLGVEVLSTAIENEDVKTLSSVSGLGKKTAERIILELKGKLPTGLESGANISNNNETVIEALENFGYKRKEILEVLKSIPEEITKEQEIVKYFLKSIR
jgi:Holliday junction DNA helicase RuvA